MYLLNNQKSNCYGCTACTSVCPKDCIKMIQDDEGFCYPKIDFCKCMKCNVCIIACPYNKNTSRLLRKIENPIFYGVKNKNLDMRLNSSSGGIFIEVARDAIKKNGVVYGAVFDSEKLSISHIRASNFDEVLRMRGSKYVQSNQNGIYKKVREDLNKGLYVVYTGTPCQVGGLLEFLNHDYENLITVDFICHGVPSPKIFSDYLKFISNGRIIKSVNFRDKSISWDSSSMKIEFNDGKFYISKWTRDPYYALFFKDLILRPSCYECKFSTLNRTSDITMGDFWGIEKYYCDFKDNAGVSFLIINTTKGKFVFDSISSKFDYIIVKPEDARQPNLYSPTVKPSNRVYFWSDNRRMDFIDLLKKYTNYGVKNKIKLIINYYPKFLTKKLYSLLKLKKK